jgi:hypothetical protein
MANAIKGVIMELQDCAFPVLTSIVGTTDYKTAFTDVDSKQKNYKSKRSTMTRYR